MSEQTIITTPFGALMRESVRDSGIYIADRLAPPVSSPTESGEYRYATREEIKRKSKATKDSGTVDDNRVGPGGKYNSTESKFTTDSFLCIKRGEEAKLTDEDRERADNYFDAQSETSQRAVFATLNAREKRIVALALTTGSGAFATAAAAAGWGSAPTTATPFKDIQTGVDAVKNNLGMPFTPFTSLVAVMNPVDYRAMTNTDDFKDRFKFTQAGMRTPETLQAVAQALGVGDLWIPSATADDMATPIWTTGKVGIYFVSNTKNLEKDPRAMNQFYYDKFEDGFMFTGMRRPDDGTETEYHKAREFRIKKLINEYAGYVLTGTNAAAE